MLLRAQMKKSRSALQGSHREEQIEKASMKNALRFRSTWIENPLV